MKSKSAAGESGGESAAAAGNKRHKVADDQARMDDVKPNPKPPNLSIAVTVVFFGAADSTHKSTHPEPQTPTPNQRIADAKPSTFRPHTLQFLRTKPISQVGFSAAAAEASLPIYSKILEMEFITEMLEGTLDKDVMAKYLVQVPPIGPRAWDLGC